MKLRGLVGRGRALLVLAGAWLALLLLLVASPVLRPPAPAPASPVLAAPDAHLAALHGARALGGDGASGQLTPEMARRLALAFSDLDALKRQTAELRALVVEVSNGDPSMYRDLQDRLKQAETLLQQSTGGMNVLGNKEPTSEYEQLRRRLKNGVHEFWYYMSSELHKLQKQAQTSAPQMVSKINSILEMGEEHEMALLTDLSSLQKADQYDGWREKEAAELSDLVQRRLHFLQNPPDCSQARKLVCSLNKGCGFGCQLHHAVYCFMVAYGTERTLILKSFGWRYHKGGWEEVFLPLSNTCRDGDGATYAHWPGKPHTQVVDLPIIDSLSPRPPYLPLSVPADLAPRLSRLHGNPFVWWVGQFLKYMLRPQTSISTLLQESAHKLGFEKPIVGVHIRRTDKVGTEAAFHPIEQYMDVVEKYFDVLEYSQKVEQRRIYLASDDPRVIAETKRKYPHYEILGDPVVAKSAAVATRYSDNSLMGIIVDIHFLSLSDYLVCTFSSQVCRVAYEIMQSLHPDAADRFHSLDDIYYYGGQLSHNQVAIYPHSAQSPGELDLKVGDQVGVAGNHWDGYSKGKNLRTDKIGLYPSFKVVDKVEVVDFPTYSEVPLKKPSNKDSKT
ncbi:hypothetical protein R5R35_012584 [Gryllus longicercus]|uniref:Alpha-(1,6)-fucosyltransferase n=1 Tax=Gryllus longicercus TaxID=2509291 RepID=A0AAN9Z279_9ORTH